MNLTLPPLSPLSQSEDVVIYPKGDLDTFTVTLPHDGLLKIRAEDIPSQFHSTSIYHQRNILFDSVHIGISNKYVLSDPLSNYHYATAGLDYIP